MLMYANFDNAYGTIWIAGWKLYFGLCNYNMNDLIFAIEN